MKGHHFKIVPVFMGVLFLGVSSVCAETAEQYLSSANDSFKRGNFDQAISDYTKAIDVNPNFSKAYNNRGVAYADEGSLQRAIDDFTLAIAITPKDSEAYNNRGHAYEAQGNLTQAISDYTSAIGINPFYAKAYNNREIAFYKLEKYDQAWADVHTVEAIGATVDPNFIKELRKTSGKDQ